METASDRGTTPLLERETELRAVDDLLRSSDARSRLLCIAGPAGAGKTRLIEALRANAAQRGMKVVAARGGELEREQSFGIARQLFARTVRALGSKRRNSALAGAAGIALPVLGLGAEGAEEMALPSILHGLYWLAANLAESAPLIVVLDDAHWADAESLEWVLYLARRAEALPIGIALSYREGEPGAPDALLQRLAAEPLARVCRPPPLSEGAVAALVRNGLGGRADDEFCAACHEATRGNPLLVNRVVGALAAEGIKPTADAVDDVRRLGPRAVADSLFLRIAQMPAAAGALAEAVAVLESEDELRVAARVADIDVNDAAVAGDALTAADVFAPGRPLTFVHPVLRASIYGEIPAGRRGLLHARAAHALRAEGAEPDRVARHLLRTEPAEDPWTAARLREAAAREAGRGASGAAVHFLRRALREPPPPADRAQVLFELGSAEARIGDPAGADHLSEAREGFENPVARAQASLAQGRVLMATGQVGPTAAVLEAAIADLAGRDRETDLHLTAEFLAVTRLGRDTRARGLDMFSRIELPERAGTAGERALLTQAAAELCALDRPAEEAAAAATKALEGGHLARHEGPESFTACYALGVAERFDDAHREATATIDDARSRGSIFRFVHVLYVRGEIELKRGRLDAAEADARLGLDALNSGPWPLARALLARVLVDVLIERGHLEEAAAELAASGLQGQPVMIYPQNSLTHTRGRLLLAQGDAQAAATELLACGARQDEWRVPSPAMTPWRSSAAEALVAAGDSEQALPLAREEVELARRIGAPRTLGVAQRALALASPNGEQVELLQEACATLERAGAPLEHARALTDLGAALRRADRRSDARQALARALDMAHSCGAGGLVDRADKELLAAGSRHRRVALEGPDALTPSERRIAELAASGTSNRELAQSLFVTVKTVEMHLANAYRKLGIHSRSELPRALGRGGDTPG